MQKLTVPTNFKRILIKLSGEALLGEKGSGINPGTLKSISDEIHSVHLLGVQIGVVIGGGNIFRGVTSAEYNIERVTADRMGMLATVINALALSQSLNSTGSLACVMNAFDINQVAEEYRREKALEYLDNGGIVIFSGGTGNPYFTTDTAATLRAVEINAQVILKATHVDGVYERDPLKNPGVKRFKSVTYNTVLRDKLNIIDMTAVSMAMEHHIPIIVFNIGKPGNIEKIISGHKVGTIITGEDDD